MYHEITLILDVMNADEVVRLARRVAWPFPPEYGQRLYRLVDTLPYDHPDCVSLAVNDVAVAADGSEIRVDLEMVTLLDPGPYRDFLARARGAGWEPVPVRADEPD